MKKFIALVFALFFATAAVAETFVASEKIEQQIQAGSLKQSVFAGNEIETIRILYTFTEGKEGYIKAHQSGNISDIGLTESWEGNVCTISGKINRNLTAQTIKAYILVQDDEDMFAKTELEFEVKAKPFSFTWDAKSGEMDQSVKVGETIVPIVFNYDGIKTWGVSELPSGLKKDIDENNHLIIITGTIDADVAAGDYKYNVIVTDESDAEHTLSGTISVKGLSNVTDIHIVETERQKVTAGDAIKPIVLEVANANTIKIEDAPPGNFKGTSEDGITLIVNGTVDEKAKDSTYSMRIIAVGDVNYDTAFATIEVVHKSAVTSSSSNSAELSSSSANSSDPKSASGTAETSSSNSTGSDKNSSNEKSEKIVTASMNGAKFSFANNMLAIALPTSSTVRVQVFDLTGHLVESLVEPVSGSRNFSLAHLNKGNYLVRVESNSQTRTAKITVK